MRELHIIGLAVLWTSNCVSSGFAQRQDPYLRGRVPPLPSSRQYSPFDLARQRLDNPPPPVSSGRPSRGRIHPLAVPDNADAVNEVEAPARASDGMSWFRSRFYMKYPSMLPYTRSTLHKEHFLYLPEDNSSAPDSQDDTVMDAAAGAPFSGAASRLQ
uniref:Transmembrane protein n=1 Tax=Toxoplasma gondii (strain ATCC 50861 / VEG) TaxID=432359 RepID=A0A0F7VC92_TOXGV|nr:TPA: hypothetical protein BN1205_098710 [Toxoplasma gondii VEG]